MDTTGTLVALLRQAAMLVWGAGRGLQREARALARFTVEPSYRAAQSRQDWDNCRL